MEDVTLVFAVLMLSATMVYTVNTWNATVRIKLLTTHVVQIAHEASLLFRLEMLRPYMTRAEMMKECATCSTVRGDAS